MGWTYNEYIDSPKWFIEYLKAKLEIDNDNFKKSIKRK